MQPSISRGILWGVIQSPLIISPLYPVGSPHHTTLQFGVGRQDWKEWENLEFQATTLYEAWNGKIQAVAIQLPDHIPCANKYPHISVSWQSGVSPVKSNLMLASKFDYRLIVQSVKMKIEFLEWIE